LKQIKFYFNTKTLSYERYRVSWKKRLLNLGYFILTTLVFSVVVLYVGFEYLDSPKELRMKHELGQLRLQVEHMSERMELAETVLKDLQDRDNEVYRAIFEAEPIPPEIRSAGIGGSNRTKALDGFTFSSWLSSEVARIDQLTRKLYVQSKSYDEIWDMIRDRDRMLASIPAIMPVNIKQLKFMASGFGYRIDPIYKTPKFHAGMDFVAEVGTPVYATGNGIVFKADREAGGYGNHVRISHGFGYLTLYGHLSEYLVRPGQKIKRGDIIGRVGNTGKSTGPHLHYEVHKNGTPVNPANYYYADITPEEYATILEASKQYGQSFD
jgi:murein DD-endopeptidase MepM/ murein hydrolase activator NlpD